MRVVFFSLFVALFSTSVLANANLQFDKSHRQFTFEWKTYSISSEEEIALYGAKKRRFLTDTLYWGEAGYGALSGKRSGYLEGGVMMGVQRPFWGRMLSDTRMFFGAGGGGSAPQGGGMILHGSFGLGMPVTQSITSFIEVGYIKFLNGKIKSPTVAFTINWNYWELSAK